MIDLHTHALWGLDDGPGTPEESVWLGSAAVESGTRRLAATPHLRADFPGVRVEELAARCGELNGRLRANGVPLEVVSGAEVDFVWAQTASPEALRLASYGGRGTDLLLETPYRALTPAFEAVVFRLATLGFRTLLAHPERNPTYQQEPEALARLVRRGALVQVTARSLVPARGERSRSRAHRLAAALVRDGLAHVLASDAHEPAGRRSPDLSPGVAAAARLAPGHAEWMVTEAPAAILAGEPLPAAPRARPRRGGLLRRVLGS